MPSEAQTPRVPDMRQQMSEPEEDNQGKMIFQGYLGIYDERIAIFFGQPPDGSLQYVTDFKVREDLREQLAVGVPFRDASELLALLENYTS
ncbi:MAG: BofC C-terminal domain-containing protein [Clostridium sp.]|nr:BofC C-terminal domain-containing protein [Clostridium sp.]